MDPYSSVPYELHIHGAALRALAAALVGGSDAEDLVQETALRALRRPPPRPAGLGAFLATILRNLARKHRRGERRRQEREELAARPEALPAADELAAHHEVLRRVGAAVFALAEPYRTTLLLRYFDELTPTAIAARTATPLATVKSRLQRGLGLLRAELDRSDRGRVWQAALMAVAGRPRPSWVLSVAGLPAAAFLGLAMVLGAVLWLLSIGRPEPLGPATAIPGLAAEGIAASDPRSDAVREALPDASTLAAQGGSDSGPAPQFALVRGRCVDAETGRPIAGARAAFGGYPGNEGEMARHGPVSWQDPEPVPTDAEGRFEIRFVPPPPYQHWLDLGAEGRTPRTARWGAFQPGQVEDLGDIAFVRGYEVRGKVVDPSGAPVARTAVALRNLPLPIAARMGANDVRYGESDERGEFRVMVPIPAGTWPLDVQRRGLKLVQPDSVLVRKDRGAEPITVVVRRMPSVSGVVVDEAGTPLTGICLEMAPVARAGPYRTAATNSVKGGRFEIFAVDDAPLPARLTVTDPGPCEPWPGQEDVPWGARDLRIALKRALSLELTVVERGNDRPVEAYSVVCHATRAQSSREVEPRLGGVHPQGLLMIDKVWRGDNVLRVLPNDPALSPSDELHFAAADPGVPSMRVELERRPSLAVRVLRTNGAPVAGSSVEMIRPGAANWTLTAWMGVPELAGMPETHQGPVVLSTARTDGNGHATVFGLADRKDLVVRVRGQGHPPLLVTGVAAGGTGELELRVEEGATVCALVVPPPALRLNLSITVIHAGQYQAPRPVAKDGTLRFEHLSAAETCLILTAHAPQDFLLGGWNAPVELCRTQVRTAGSSEVKVELDASAWQPARLEGIVTLNGKAPASARVFLVGRRGGAPWRHGPFTPDDKGRFTAEALLPGNYQTQLVVGDFRTEQGTTLQCDRELDLEPGSSVRHELLFKTP